MTYNEKKSLYESIMKDVAKVIKQKLNEINSQYNIIRQSQYLHDLINQAEAISAVESSEDGYVEICIYIPDDEQFIELFDEREHILSLGCFYNGLYNNNQKSIDINDLETSDYTNILNMLNDSDFDKDKSSVSAKNVYDDKNWNIYLTITDPERDLYDNEVGHLVLNKAGISKIRKFLKTFL